MALSLDQSTYWTQVADSKSFSHQLNPQWLEEAIPTHAHILDVGCGYGRTLQELRQQGYSHLMGIDNATGMISRGQALFPHLHLQQYDGSTFPFADRQFDAVILFAVLTCIPKDQDLKQLLAEIYRVLRPEGILYISDLLLNQDERNQKRYSQFAGKYGTYGIFELPDGAVLRHFEASHIQTLTQAFTQLKYQEQSFITMNGNEALGFQWMGKK